MDDGCAPIFALALVVCAILWLGIKSEKSSNIKDAAARAACEKAGGYYAERWLEVDGALVSCIQKPIPVKVP